MKYTEITIKDNEGKEIVLKFIENLKFVEKCLIPAVVKEIDTKEVLMLAYMNKESMKETLINKCNGTRR